MPSLACTASLAHMHWRLSRTTCTLIALARCCRATEGHGPGGAGLTAAQAGAMGVPASGPVTSTSGATRIIVLENCVQREELLPDECATPSDACMSIECASADPGNVDGCHICCQAFQLPACLLS
jgi:hypothetical protein